MGSKVAMRDAASSQTTPSAPQYYLITGSTTFLTRRESRVELLLPHESEVEFYVFQTYSQGTDSTLRNRFNDLADRWEKETAHLSSISRRRDHTYFSYLTKIGPRAIPWALERIKKGNPFWFLVLKEIVPNGPTEPCDGDMVKVRSQWLEWGKQHGHVS